MALLPSVSSYDLTFALYAGLIIAIVFMVLPERFFMRAWPRRFALLVYFGLLISLVFTVLAEIVFWEEFSTRFNFIAVDYLVYRHEVTNNIYESYPVVTLLLGGDVNCTNVFLCNASIRVQIT